MLTNTTQTGCIETIEQAKAVQLEQIERRVEPDAVLMCPPVHFDVIDVKNPFMANNAGKVDHKLALQQWQVLKDSYIDSGFPVLELQPVDGLEDMVFAANQSLVGRRNDGSRYIVPSNMAHASRRREVPHYVRWFEEQGYEVIRLPVDAEGKPGFEGHGDGLWHPGRQLLYVAYGNRTDEATCELLAERLSVKVVKIKLAGDLFYHLDAALCMLDETTALIYPAAFDPRSLSLLRHFFPNRIEVSEKDALNFACNAVALKKKVFLHKGSDETCARLRALGYEPIEVDTGEFMKSGGSAFCMKVMIYK